MPRRSPAWTVGAIRSLAVVGARGIYSIGSVSRMLGLSQAAIRSWEDRYGLIVAGRNEGGRRIYTNDQLEQLRFIKEQLDQGLSAADAHRLLAERQSGAQPVVEPGTQPVVEPGTQAVVERPPSSPRQRLLVLLAESDRYGAEITDLSLRGEGFDVEIASSASEAEEKFASRHPALTIVELMISGGVGRELCKRLKMRRETPLLCISSLDLEEHALAAGADAFLKKPFDPRQLVSTVTTLINDRDQQRTRASTADG